jgi:SAM-dependent methyltransferase
METPGTIRIEDDDYDAAHAAVHGSPLMRRLFADAMGDGYPAEVDPFSSCSWWLLGRLVTALRMPPGGRLVDLGCGRGGPGLWLARALAAQLDGVDFSRAAVEVAAARAPSFVPAGRARFHRRTFAGTGLPDACADGAVSVDALPFAPDREAALREAHRILTPGARLAFTARVTPGASDPPGDWPAMGHTTGFDLEETHTDEGVDPFWARLHASWLAHADALHAELGERAAANLLTEARVFATRRADLPPAQLLVLRRR